MLVACLRDTDTYSILSLPCFRCLLATTGISGHGLKLGGSFYDLVYLRACAGLKAFEVSPTTFQLTTATRASMEKCYSSPTLP